MVLETEIRAVMVADIDKKSFGDGVQFARDTGKKIDQELKSKLEIDIAQAQIKLDKAKKMIQQAKKDGDQQLQLSLQIETNELQRGLTESKRQLNNLSNTGDANLSRLQAKFNQTNATIRETRTALTTVGGAIQGVYSAGVALAGIGIVSFFKNVGSSILSVAGAFQKYEVILTNALQSQDKAKESLKLLKEISAETPFTLDEITKSYIKMVNRGMTPTRKEIISLGDLASSQGKKFDQLVEALLDAQTGEFERLKEFGVKAKVSGDQVSFTFRGVETTAKKTESAIQAYILSLGNLTGVSGSMETQSQTLEGAISNFEDSITNLSASIGTLFIPILTSATRGLSDVANSLNKFVGGNQTLVTILGGSIASLTAFLGITTGISIVLPGLKLAAVAFGVSLGSLGLIIGGVVLGATTLVGIVNALRDDLGILGQKIADNTDAQRKLDKAFKDGSITAQEYNNKMKSLKLEMFGLVKSYDTAEARTKTFRGRVAKRFRDGANDAITVLRALANATNNFLLGGIPSGAGAARAGSKGVPVSISNSPGIARSIPIPVNVKGLQAPKEVDNVFSRIGAESALSRVFENEINLDDLGGGGGGGGGGGSKAKEEVKDFTKEVEEARKEIQKLKDDLQEKFRKSGTAAFEAISKSVDDTSKNIEKLNDELKKTGDQLQDIETKIAKRSLDIKKEIEDINEKIQGKTTDEIRKAEMEKAIKEDRELQSAKIRSSIEYEKKLQEVKDRVNKQDSFGDTGDKELNKLIQQRAKLEKELELSKSSVNQDVLKEEERRGKLSETEKLLEERKGINDKISEIEKDISKEEGLYKKLTEVKSGFLEKFSEKYGIELQKQEDLLKQSVERQIELFRKIQSGSKAASGESGPASSIQTAGNNGQITVSFGQVNINNGTDEKQFYQRLEKAVSKAKKGSSLGFQ